MPLTEGLVSERTREALKAATCVSTSIQGGHSHGSEENTEKLHTINHNHPHSARSGAMAPFSRVWLGASLGASSGPLEWVDVDLGEPMVGRAHHLRSAMRSAWKEVGLTWVSLVGGGNTRKYAILQQPSLTHAHRVASCVCRPWSQR